MATLTGAKEAFKKATHYNINKNIDLATAKENLVYLEDELKLPSFIESLDRGEFTRVAKTLFSFTVSREAKKLRSDVLAAAVTALITVIIKKKS